MNKMMIIVSVTILIISLNFGISMNVQKISFERENAQISQENESMVQELNQKACFVRKTPIKINKAFNLFIKLIRMIKDYGGTRFELFFPVKGENEDLEDCFTNSIFRNVKMLPIILKINHFSKGTNLVSILNDIYTLEKQSDFKVNEITNENEILEIKGELYGI